MSYETFGEYSFVVYLFGCFTAFALALRSPRDASVLPFIYGAWISAFYGLFHGRANDFHFWWYLLNASADAFIVFCAWMLRDASARKPVMALGVMAMVVDMTYMLTAWMAHQGWMERLPGSYYNSFSEIFESLQVLSMIVFSGPIIPILTKGRNFLTKKKEPPWTQHRQVHRA